MTFTLRSFLSITTSSINLFVPVSNAGIGVVQSADDWDD